MAENLYRILPTSFAALHADLGFLIDALRALPHEKLWDGNPQFHRESMQMMINRLEFMLTDTRYLTKPGYSILGRFADILADRTPKPDTELRLGDHRSYAVRLLYSQLSELLALERRWTLQQPYVQMVIHELAVHDGHYFGRLLLVHRAIRKHT